MISRAIPTINTSRLTLRAMSPQDFDRFSEIWAMPEVVAYIGGVPRSRSASWASFLRNAGQWQITGFGQWAIEQRSTKRIIGQVGFFHGCRDLGEDFDTSPEAGWVLAPEAQHQGFGIEACQAAHEWYDRVVTGPLACLLSAENAASARIAQHLGYAPLRVCDLDGHAVQLMTRAKPPAPA